MFYFTPRLLADLFALDIDQVYRLVPRLKESGLILEAEAEGYCFYAQEAIEFAESSARTVTDSLIRLPYLPSSDA